MMPSMGDEQRRHKLPRAARVGSQAVFRQAYQSRAAYDRWLSLRAVPNNLDLTRLGISVSRKFGPAVRRNRIRRLIREAFRHVRLELPVGLDMIVLPRTDLATEPTVTQLQDSLRTLATQVARRMKHAGS